MSKLHFKEKKEWTKFKHEILVSTLKVSLNNAKQNNFLYLDGLAGAGVFEDGNDGSPLMVLREVNDMLSNYPRRKQFRVDAVFFEFDKTNYDILDSNLSKLNYDSRLVINSFNNDFYGSCKDILLTSTFGSGLVFIDPCGIVEYRSEPIDLTSMINSNIDLLINFPSYVYRRVAGQGKVFDGARERISDVLDMDYETDHNEMYSNYLKTLRTKYKSVNEIELKNNNKHLYTMILCTNNLHTLYNFNDLMYEFQTFLKPNLNSLILNNLDFDKGDNYKHFNIKLINEHFGVFDSNKINEVILNLIKQKQIGIKKSHNSREMVFESDVLKESSYLQKVVI